LKEERNNLVDLAQVIHTLADSSASTQVAGREQEIDLQQALDKLPDKRRRFIQLYYLEGNSYAEIAAKMNPDVKALYKLHYDALSDLNNRLAGKQ
jgi:RNA polymerase sigma factor (sigma-70 family)